MKLLDFLERSMERVVQGPVDAMFRQDIQPAEIEHKLERAMLDNSRRASGASIMPNKYIVRLNASDFEAIRPFRSSLSRRLESWLSEAAARHNGTLLDRIQVELDQDDRARRRRPIVSATITDIQDFQRDRSPEPAGRTEAFSVVHAEQTVTIRILTGPQQGASFPLRDGTTTLGRSVDADVRIDASDVSRKHMRFERHGPTVTVADLDSTNGTRVNGERIHHATLRNGDEIQAGNQVLRFVHT